MTQRGGKISNMVNMDTAYKTENKKRPRSLCSVYIMEECFVWDIQSYGPFTYQYLPSYKLIKRDFGCVHIYNAHLLHAHTGRTIVKLEPFFLWFCMTLFQTNYMQLFPPLQVQLVHNGPGPPKTLYLLESSIFTLYSCTHPHQNTLLYASQTDVAAGSCQISCCCSLPQ